MDKWDRFGSVLSEARTRAREIESWLDEDDEDDDDVEPFWRGCFVVCTMHYVDFYLGRYQVRNNTSRGITSSLSQTPLAKKKKKKKTLAK